MFKDHPSHKKMSQQRPGKSAGAPHGGKETMEGYSKIGGTVKNTMEHCSAIEGGKAREPKVMSHYFGDPKGK